MPELPDIAVYVERIQAVAGGQALHSIRIVDPFILRTVTPPADAFVGRVLESAGRIGKRVVLEFTGQYFAVLHLMIAGRLHWRRPSAPVPKGNGMLAFDFEAGSLVLTEASTKRRASLHLVKGREGLAAFDRGGVDIASCTAGELAAVFTSQNRTLKRALTDPSIVDGIGNAYSDEILHRARLSPFLLTGNLSASDVARLQAAARDVVAEWIARLRAEAGEGFPEKVTAFRPEMAVHGKYGQPCPVCGAPIQRIVYAENEANYCPGCQTGGRMLADRSLSRLLKDDWPRTLDELEKLRPASTTPSGHTGQPH